MCTYHQVHRIYKVCCRVDTNPQCQSQWHFKSINSLLCIFLEKIVSLKNRYHKNYHLCNLNMFDCTFYTYVHFKMYLAGIVLHTDLHLKEVQNYKKYKNLNHLFDTLRNHQSILLMEMYCIKQQAIAIACKFKPISCFDCLFAIMRDFVLQKS